MRRHKSTANGHKMTEKTQKYNKTQNDHRETQKADDRQKYYKET